jgi:hypothetical protein
LPRQFLQLSKRRTVRRYVESEYAAVSNGSPSSQMNMDYALCQALKLTHLGDIKTVMLYYDIICQFIVNLYNRVARNPHLELPEDIKIVPGIGLMHVTEHKPQCLPRYAPTFIQGAGLVAGKIIESLWSGLNGCVKSTRTATAANRAETLDDHMNDNNWLKLVNIGDTDHGY